MPPVDPLMLILFRRGCLNSLDSACRRADGLLPLTKRPALRPPPFAEDVSCRIILRKCFCALSAECFDKHQ